MKDPLTSGLPGFLTTGEAPSMGGELILLGVRDPELARPIMSLVQGDGHQVLQGSDFDTLIDHVYESGGQLSAGILDIELLLHEGVDLIERMHAMKPGMPVLVLSPFGHHLPRLETEFLHNIRMVRKPLDPVLVRSRLREALGIESSGESRGPDRRAFPRMNLDAKAALTLPGGKQLPLVDISAGGLAVLSDCPFGPGHTLDFSFRMVSGFATVVRSRPYSRPGPFQGVNHLVRCRFGATMHPMDVEVLLDLLR